jgi:hypothetical protein
MRARNLATTLRQRSRGDPMAQFDALPRDLRRWLARARLPWSPHSVRALWVRALVAEGEDAARALAWLDRAETRALMRDSRRLWGAGYPLMDGERP